MENVQYTLWSILLAAHETKAGWCKVGEIVTGVRATGAIMMALLMAGRHNHSTFPMCTFLMEGRIFALLAVCTMLFVLPLGSDALYCKTEGFAANSTCSTYALYRTIKNGETLTSVSTYFNVSAQSIGELSNITNVTSTLGDEQLLYIPVACTCVNGTAQMDVLHFIEEGDTFYWLSTAFYGGLTTYQAIEDRNPSLIPTNLQIGEPVEIPISCACPTPTQMENNNEGFFLTYGVLPTDSLDSISARFGITTAELIDANELNSKATLNDYTPLFIPLNALLSLSDIVFTGIEGQRINRKLIIIISTSAAIFVFLVSIISLLIIKRLLKRIRILREIQLEFAKNEVKPYLYSYNELKIATRDFHPDNKLGEGGFGIVHKGVQSDGTPLAVKRLRGKKEVRREFLTEIVTISGIKHRNLVKLKGCCLKDDRQILVYEYVENKNLAEALWGGGFKLDWTRRFDIILGISRGLAYLHEEVQPPIIHRDIKAPNILLDKKICAKIADFGLALLFPTFDDEQTHMSAEIVGTRGYLAPEYASFGQISAKVDVFSFGILVLEIVSGRKNVDLTKSTEQQYLLHWAWNLHRSEQLWELIDKTLIQDITTIGAIEWMINIGLLCVQYAPAMRPTMSHVVSMCLNGKLVETIVSPLVDESLSTRSFDSTSRGSDCPLYLKSHSNKA